MGLAELDSARGDFVDAYTHYKMYIAYRDSSFNEETAKRTQQIKMQYEFDKKDATVKEMQDKKDAASMRTRNLQYFAIGAILLIALFLYINSRQKQKAKSKIEKAYSELKSTQAQLIQSAKMASLGELTAGIEQNQDKVNHHGQRADSIVKACCKAHGGELKVETKEGEGAEFIIQLPIT